MGQLNVPKTKGCQSKDTITSFDCAKFHWNPSACGRDFSRERITEMSPFSWDFWWKIMISQDSWNHRRITPGSLLRAPRSPSRLVDLSKLLKSPRISNHEKRRFNVTSDPLLTSFSTISLCWRTMEILKHHPSHSLSQGQPNMVQSTLLHSQMAKTRVPENHSNTDHFQRPLSWVS